MNVKSIRTAIKTYKRNKQINALSALANRLLDELEKKGGKKVRENPSRGEIPPSVFDRLRKAAEIHAAMNQADEEIDDVDSLEGFDKSLKKAGFRSCGLNADWAVDAFHLTTGTVNDTNGEIYLIDCEDGTWELVRRWYYDYDAGSFTECPDDVVKDHAYETNDIIEPLMDFADLWQIVRWVK